jgi:hypothetical protein
MNIFALSPVPEIAARWHCDKHVSKMIVESGQMLSTAHRILDGVMDRRLSKTGKTRVRYWELEDERSESTLYKAVHTGHPCTVWTMTSHLNYKWHYQLFTELCKEYTFRYGKKHLTEKVLHDILKDPPKNIKMSHMTPFALAMGAAPECIDHCDPIGSYQNFYQTKQSRFSMKWSKREIPHWFKSL